MESRPATPNKKAESKHDEPLMKTKSIKPTKMVVRLLPPALSPKDFHAILCQLISPDLIESTYYVQGHYSKRPFKQPTYSRCYLRLKDEKMVNSLYLSLSTVIFRNSAPDADDEMGESVELNLEEEFKPKVEKAVYSEMNFPHVPMHVGTFDDTIQDSPVFKLFVESLDTQDDGESILSKVADVERRKAKKQNKKKKQEKKVNETNGQVAKTELEPKETVIDVSMSNENLSKENLSKENLSKENLSKENLSKENLSKEEEVPKTDNVALKKTRPKKKPKKVKRPKPEEVASEIKAGLQGKDAPSEKPSSAGISASEAKTKSPSEPVKKRKPKKKVPKPANSPKPKPPVKAKEPKTNTAKPKAPTLQEPTTN